MAGTRHELGGEGKEAGLRDAVGESVDRQGYQPAKRAAGHRQQPPDRCLHTDRAEQQALRAPTALQQEAGDEIEDANQDNRNRSEEHTSEHQSRMRISYAVFCLKQKKRRSIMEYAQ